jgi:hypothetical protein
MAAVSCFKEVKSFLDNAILAAEAGGRTASADELRAVASACRPPA